MSLALAVVAGHVAIAWGGRARGPWSWPAWLVVGGATFLLLLPEFSAELMPRASGWVADANGRLATTRLPLVLVLLVGGWIAASVAAWWRSRRSGTPEIGGAPHPWRTAMARGAQAVDRVPLRLTARLVAGLRRAYRWDPPPSAPSAGPEPRRWWVAPVRIWAAVQGAIIAITYLAGDSRRAWAQQDTELYVRIAQDGPDWTASRSPTVVAFPGYGLLIRWFEPVFGDHVAAAIAISFVAGLALALAFWRWMTVKGLDGHARWCGAVAFAVYPYSFFFFGIAYSDGLFTVLAILAFLLVELDRPVLAGLAGAAATFSRPTGLALIVGLVVLQAERLDAIGPDHRLPSLWRARPVATTWAWLRGAWRRAAAAGLGLRHAALLVCTFGFTAYALYCWRTFGDPIAFWSAQRWYGHGTFFAPRTWGKEYYLTTIISGEWNGHSRLWFVASVANTMFMTALLAVAALVLPAVRRRFGLGYAAYIALIILQTWVGATNMGATGRYLVAAFPLFGLAGLWLAGSRRRQVAVLVPSAVLAGGFLWLFMNTAGIPSW